MALMIDATPLVDGAAEGTAMKLGAPISFWGGIDAADGTVIQAGHPDRGRSIADTVLVLPGLIGSSSSSAIMLELLHVGTAPRALLLAGADAILPLGVIVSAEMGWPTIPVLVCDVGDIADGDLVSITPGGGVSVATPD